MEPAPAAFPPFVPLPQNVRVVRGYCMRRVGQNDFKSPLKIFLSYATTGVVLEVTGGMRDVAHHADYSSEISYARLFQSQLGLSLKAAGSQPRRLCNSGQVDEIPF